MLEQTTLENFLFLLIINCDATAQYQMSISPCLISFSFAVSNFPATGFIVQKVTSTTKSPCGTVPLELNHLYSSRTKNYDNILHVITLLSEHPKKRKKKESKIKTRCLSFTPTLLSLIPYHPPLSLDQTDS